jgi:hypothetical protein
VANLALSLDDIRRIIRDVDRFLDDEVHPQYRQQPLAQDWARTGKVAEEAGEAIRALIGFTEQNPRKGMANSETDFLAELGDTCCAAMFAIQHFTKDTELTWQILLEALVKARSRIGVIPGSQHG